MQKKFFLFLILFLIFIGLEISLRILPPQPLQEIKEEETHDKKEAEKIKVILAGDVMLGRKVMVNAFKRKNFSYPFERVADKLLEADLVFINLENPIIKNCPFIYSGFTFCAKPEMIEGLKKSGIDIVNLANNHSENFGKEGKIETIDRLKKEGIESTGVNNLIIKVVKNVKFGFLGFDFVYKKPKESDFELVRDSDKKVDVLIVGVHWGKEYEPIADNNQQEIARKLIENGADVIAGHHPHWVQNIERINNKPVYYSLGNFVFDQMWSEKTKEGLLVELVFEEKEIIKENLFKTYIHEEGQPVFVKSN